jgi:DNA-binding NtrC family response regulator
MEQPIVGISRMAREVEEDITLAAQSSACVLITGESGVGKGSVAQLVHDRGPRFASPFVSVSCASAVGFGADSDIMDAAAVSDRRPSWRGRLESADGGTLFLAGVGDAGARMQRLLARFLETRELPHPGGIGRGLSVDVRIIASTHRALTDLVADQRFRSDLYYRLNVVHIVVPPLRERHEDVLFLMNHYLRRLAAQYEVPTPRLTAAARQRLTDYHWPGNVRELRRVAERLVRHCRDGSVGVNDLPGEVWLHPLGPLRSGNPGRTCVLKLIRPGHQHARSH